MNVLTALLTERDVLYHGIEAVTAYRAVISEGLAVALVQGLEVLRGATYEIFVDDEATRDLVDEKGESTAAEAGTY